jgi:NADH:ubiquinone oxidoreductase subunit F (NADH-binding)
MGHVNVTGLIEVPMGITLREVIAIYAKGMKPGRTFKLAQTGGSSGSIIPASLQDTPMDFDSFAKAGVALGSGALLICDEDTCVVDLAKVLVNFFRVESCGMYPGVGNQRAYTLLINIPTRSAMQDLKNSASERNYSAFQLRLGQTALARCASSQPFVRSEALIASSCRPALCPISGQKIDPTK